MKASGSWATAVLKLQRSNDQVSWQDLPAPKVTAEGHPSLVDCSGFRYLGVVVETVEGTAGAADLFAETSAPAFRRESPRQQLGQLRPADTNPASLYSPASGRAAEVERVIIANTTGAGATFRLFHDEDGTTYDETTALAWDITVGAGAHVIVELHAGMQDPAGNLAVRSGTANALTFTAYGRETP